MKVKLFIALIILSTAIFGCKKDFLPVSKIISKTDLIDNAKLYLIKNKNLFKDKELILNINSLSWLNSKTVLNESGNWVLFVPFKSNSKLNYSEFSFLIDDKSEGRALIKQYLGNLADSEVELNIYSVNGEIICKGFFNTVSRKFSNISQLTSNNKKLNSNTLKAEIEKRIVSKFRFLCADSLYFNTETSKCDLKVNVTDFWASRYFWTYIYDDGSIKYVPDHFEIEEIVIRPPDDGNNGNNGNNEMTNGETGGSGGGVGGGGGGISVKPGGDVKPTVEEIKFQLYKKPFSLSQIPCDQILHWLRTATFEVSEFQIEKLNTIRAYPQIIPGLNPETIARIQKIDDAYSQVVNMDYFSVTVKEMPTIDGKLLNLNEIMNILRLNLNSFVSPTWGEFHPYSAYGINDVELWNSINPINTVLSIDIGGPDNGSVILSDYNLYGWTFTTIFEPKYGVHPVSGNRDFGIEFTSNGLEIYTRGVDRLTDPIHHALKKVSFWSADNLWKSFQRKVAQYINNNGGEATINEPEIIRPDWDMIQLVLNGKLPLSSLSNDCP